MGSANDDVSGCPARRSMPRIPSHIAEVLADGYLLLFVLFASGNGQIKRIHVGRVGYPPR